ncbi:putative uncharacterized protein DDB_G0290521 [Asparagus officinalis]|uniref:putative uncharacterized protein DDB_G0290521 n=1 Tax=Asparagus officinalis TaxID=4686 RepID=UPI00098E44BB|nr:putative uncharacterized protein DDB_G0290521 [Asparagus officinalis]
MASGGSSGRTSSGPRSFDFVSDDVLCAYDDYTNQDPPNGNRSDPSPKGFHESRMGRQLVSVYGQQDEYSKEEIIDAVEKCMKKYADNLLRHLVGITGRLSQLEIYCSKLEQSIGEFQADMIRDQSQADTKLKSLEKHLQEVHRSIQILRDKQELAETQKELTRLQPAPRESASTTKYQNNDDTIASSSVPEPKRQDDTPNVPSQHLALALPNQIPVSSSVPTRTPEMNQLPIQQQQQQSPALPSNPPHNHYTPQQPVPFYSQQSQAWQPETQAQYIQQRAQIQEPSRAPPPQHQPHIANQPQNPQPFPQYQQQHWPQPSPQQLTQQAMAPTQPPTSQSQLARPQTPPSYIPYTHQPNNQETFAYSTVPQSGVNQSSFGMPSTKPTGYASASPYAPQPNVQGYNTVYSSDGSRVQAYQRGNYPPPSNVSGMQNQHLLLGNSSGFHVRSHPYMDMIEKAVSMGYPRDQVIGVVNRMAESGQPVDFNALLDRLNSGPAAGGSRW